MVGGGTIKVQTDMVSDLSGQRKGGCHGRYIG